MATFLALSVLALTGANNASSTNETCVDRLSKVEVFDSTTYWDLLGNCSSKTARSTTEEKYPWPYYLTPAQVDSLAEEPACIKLHNITTEAIVGLTPPCVVEKQAGNTFSQIYTGLTSSWNLTLKEYYTKQIEVFKQDPEGWLATFRWIGGNSSFGTPNSTVAVPRSNSSSPGNTTNGTTTATTTPKPNDASSIATSAIAIAALTATMLA